MGLPTTQQVSFAFGSGFFLELVVCLQHWRFIDIDFKHFEELVLLNHLFRLFEGQTSLTGFRKLFHGQNGPHEEVEGSEIQASVFIGICHEENLLQSEGFLLVLHFEQLVRSHVVYKGRLEMVLVRGAIDRVVLANGLVDPKNIQKRDHLVELVFHVQIVEI